MLAKPWSGGQKCCASGSRHRGPGLPLGQRLPWAPGCCLQSLRLSCCLWLLCARPGIIMFSLWDRSSVLGASRSGPSPTTQPPRFLPALVMRRGDGVSKIRGRQDPNGDTGCLHPPPLHRHPLRFTQDFSRPQSHPPMGKPGTPAWATACPHLRSDLPLMKSGQPYLSILSDSAGDWINKCRNQRSIILND